MISAMGVDEFMNQALPVIFGGFCILWVIVFLVRLLISEWKDKD